MKRILIVAHDQVGARMAAPGIRCSEIARVLAARGHDVTLAISNDPEMHIEGVTQIRDDLATVQASAKRCDVVITGGGPLRHPEMTVPPGIPHVIDISFPAVLEVVYRHGVSIGADKVTAQENFMRDRMAGYLLSADFLICASAKQWDFYVGCLTMLRRVSYETVSKDPALRDLLAVVPFGCPASSPTRTGPGARSRVPGVSKGDFVLLWSGNTSDWYDPETVIRGVGIAATKVSNLRLVFLGSRPNVGRLHETLRVSRARDLADALGLEGHHVFFHDEWTPYDERANWLLDADAAVVAAPLTLESELSVRARFLDYVWTATPVISSRGGSFAELFERERLGIVVENEDVEGMAAAIVSMADQDTRDGFKRRLALKHGDFTWERTLEPLVAFCETPRLATDRGRPARSTPQEGTRSAPPEATPAAPQAAIRSSAGSRDGRPRVTFITHDASRTGAPAVLLTLMRWLRTNTDLKLTTLAIKPGPLLDQFAHLGPVRLLDDWPHFDRAGRLLGAVVEMASVPDAKPSSRAVRWAGENVLRGARRALLRGLRDCDLVYANSLESGRGVHAIRDHQPLISHLHEGAELLLAETSQFNVRAMVRNADRIIASSDRVQQLLIDKLDIPSSSIAVCYPFIDTKAYKVDGDKATLRSALGIPTDAFVVGMCGLASWRKGTDIFVAVARETLKRARGRNVVFLWVGGSPNTRSYRFVTHDLTRLGLTEQIRIVPSQANPFRYMRSFDVFFVSSRAEVYPLVCLEAALVAETPIVCFDGAGEMTELAGDGGGCVVPYLDVPAAASAVLTLMGDEEMRLRMGKRAAEIVRSRHDVAASAARIHKMITELV